MHTLFSHTLISRDEKLVSQQWELCVFRCVASAAHFFIYQRGGKMKRLSGGLIALITIGAVLLGLAVTNPTKDEFAEWASAQVTKEADKESFWDALGMLLGKPMIKSMTVHNNYLVFSTFEVEDTEFLGICKQFIPMEYLQLPSVKLVVEDNKKSKNTNSNQSTAQAPAQSPKFQKKEMERNTLPPPPKNEILLEEKPAGAAKPDVYFDNTVYIDSIPYIRVFDFPYNYTYLYPADMELFDTPASGRQIYYSKDGNAKMEVYALNHTNMQQELDRLITAFGGIQTYQANGETWLARSYQNDTNGRALYIKINIVNGSFLRCFTLEHPQSECWLYDKYVNVVEDNLKQNK
mgnify:CR=1 FL=1